MLVLANQGDIYLDGSSDLPDVASFDSTIATPSAGLDNQSMTMNPDLAEFCRECGKVEPVRFTLSDNNDSTADLSWLMERPFAVVGRGEQCDIRLDDPDISRRHLYLQFLGGRVFCCDLGSRTGTKVSGHAFSRGWIRQDQLIQFGAYTVRIAPNEFHDSPGSETALTDGGSSTQISTGIREPAYVLNCVNAQSNSGGGPKVRRLRDRVTLIGSNDVCTLKLNHPSVSRTHCSVVLTPLGVWAVDLTLRSKTFVNGVPVVFSRLQEGDELQIGDFRLIVDRDHLDSAMPARIDERRRSASADNNGELRDVSISSAPAVPLSGTAAEQSQLLLTIVNQFTAAQRDLFENTRQMMAAMAETFNAAHKRQMDVIREELMRVHELNSELQQLQRELLLQRYAPGSSPLRVADLPEGSAIERSVREAEAVGIDSGGTSERPSQPITDVLQPAEPSPAFPTAFENSARAESESIVSDAMPDKIPAGPAQVLDATANVASSATGVGTAKVVPSSAGTASRQEQSPGTVAATPSGSATSEEEHDLHGWLNDRISKLEQERTGRWQRIMQILSRSG